MQCPQLSLQLVTIGQSDVEKMLDSYDSGMCDTTTANAIAQALKRLLNPEHRVRVIRDQFKQSSWVEIGAHEFDLPDELCEWLARAERAFPVEAISFRAVLPNEWLKEPVRKPRKPREIAEASIVA